MSEEAESGTTRKSLLRRGLLLAGGCGGTLTDGAGRKKVGEFYSAQFATLAPFGANAFAAGALEMHTFNLADGTILGMGSHFDGNGTYAIVGGTGRYHAARGSYVATQ